MKLVTSILLFLFFLITSHLYLLVEGQWFFQDTSYWPKTNQEAWLFINSQLSVFTNYGYYLGFDIGLFAYSRIVLSTIIAVLFFLFGGGGAQIAFSVLGVVISFVSFYFFSQLFLENKNVRYILALIYAFNPIMFSLQGYTIYFVIVPLFLYSFHQFLQTKSKFFVYLLLNIFAAFIWIAYIRFIQAFLFVIIPYILYLCWNYRKTYIFKRLFILFGSYLIIFLPTFYAFLAQVLTGGTTAFNYADVYGMTVAKDPFIHAFSLFVNFPINFYSNIFQILGIMFFVVILWGLIRTPTVEIGRNGLLHLSVVLFSISIYGLANIFGDNLYKSFLIGLFPFVTNEPFFALYLLPVPLLLLVGTLARNHLKLLQGFSILFISLSILPLLNINSFQLKQVSYTQIPEQYRSYFIDKKVDFPEATLFIPAQCWRALYMDELQVPTMCLNLGLYLNSISLGDPRYTSGEILNFFDKAVMNLDIEKLKVTHNLKHIIVANDYVQNSAGIKRFETDQNIIRSTTAKLDMRTDLEKVNHSNFFDYYVKNKDQYDYSLYLANQFTQDDGSISETKSNQNLVFTKEAVSQSFSSGWVFFKTNFSQPTVYFLETKSDVLTFPLFVQLNQSYSPNWKIKKISKEMFDEVSCRGPVYHFNETKNSKCETENSPLLPMKLLFTGEKIDDVTHMQTNFTSNGWKLPLSDNSSEYYVIYYEKQSIFVIALVLSFATLSLLVLSMLALVLRKYLWK